MPWRDRDARNAYQRAYRRARGMQPRQSRTRERTRCLSCGAALGRGGSKYCSLACMNAFKRQRYIAQWLAGEIAGGSIASVSHAVRRYLLQERGERCSLCGWSERHPITGRVPLDIDHINGNYADHRPENLRLLCPNCHALTPTYKALNRGNGRPYAIVRRKL